VSEGLLHGLYIIPILAVLILVHEIGHFASARAVGVKVEEFGIGIPPRIKGWTRNGVIWSINAIPFGGFVRVLGEDGKSMEPGSMNTRSPLQRAFFLAAGSAMNFLLAIILMILVVGIDGIPSYNVYINEVVPNSPAAQAGWLAGDRLLEVAGAPVKNQGEIGSLGRSFAGKPMSAVIERDGKMIQTSVTPRQNPPKGERPIGVAVNEFPRSAVEVDSIVAGKPAATAGIEPGDRFLSINGVDASDQFAFATALSHAAGATVPAVVERGNVNRQIQLAVPAVKPTDDVLAAIGIGATAHPIAEHVPATQVIPRGFSETWDQMRGMLSGIRDLFTGAAPLNQLAGPIGMGQITSEIIGQSALPLWVTLAKISILLSLNLGVLNLLPLPALDGGRLLFVFLEVLRGGRRVAPEREGLVHFAGLVLLLGFMFVVAFLDVGRLLDGHSFLP